MNDVNLLLVKLAVAPADPVFCTPQTEARESGSAGYKGPSDCLECEAVRAMPPWKDLCTEEEKRNKIQTRKIN